MCSPSGPSLTLKAWSRASKTPVCAKALLCLASCFTAQLARASSQRPSFGAGENQQLTCHVSPPELPSCSRTRGMLRTGKCQLGRAVYLGNRGHRQEMLAGLSANVSAAGACIVWLESVGFSQREGMSRSISDSKRHSLKPATRLSFISTGSSEQLLPGIYQQVRSSRIFPPPRRRKTANDVSKPSDGSLRGLPPVRALRSPACGSASHCYLPLPIRDTRI